MKLFGLVALQHHASYALQVYVLNTKTHSSPLSLPKMTSKAPTIQLFPHAQTYQRHFSHRPPTMLQGKSVYIFKDGFVSDKSLQKSGNLTDRRQTTLWPQSKSVVNDPKWQKSLSNCVFFSMCSIAELQLREARALSVFYCFRHPL